MRKRKLIAALSVACLAVVGVVTVQSFASAAPPTATPQSDYAHCDTTADAGGYFTCELTDPVALAEDAVTFAQITFPFGGLPSLPNSVRRVALQYTDNDTPGDPTDDVILSVRWRAFSHQMVQDPSGNVRLKVYSGPISIDQKVTSRAAAYCAANPCS